MMNMDMELFSSFLFEEDDDNASKGSGYESDQEDGDKIASTDGSLTARSNNQVVEEVLSAPINQGTMAISNPYDENEMSSLSSDAQPNNNESTSGSSSPSPDSSETGDYTYDDCDEEEEFDMVFLDSKRLLLKRVADIMYADEVYDASIAKNPLRCTTPPIWAEAKEVIETLTGKPVGNDRLVTFATSTKNTSSLEHKNKKARIDFSTVSRIDSKIYCQDAMKAPSSKLAPTCKSGETSSKSPVKPKASPYSDTKWMIKALQKLSETTTSESPTSSLTSADKIQESWDIKLDPLLGIVSVEPKPSEKPHHQGTTMAEALAITDMPQLVCQASPPFLAVYANKAFFSYSRLASKDVICKPVEEIITVNKAVEKFIAQSINDENNCNGANVVDEKNCQVQVKPVVNHWGVMSHVLVQVHQECTSLDDALLFGNNAAAIAAHNNILVGAVG